MPIASTAGLVDNTKGVIPYLALEPEEFAVEAARYRAGEIDDTQFTPWRLRRGIYGQRQTDAQMVRVKLPGGLGTAEQLDALALIADELAPLKMGHITTRENIQYHHISLEDAPTVIRILGEAGLSTREACGNTVRNVIADPMMGVDPEQAFDITPYLVAYVRKFVRHPIAQSMPRKFKTAFSSGEHDPAIVGMHDLGFVARIREIDGVERKGFKMVVGGGTSILAKNAEALYEFVAIEDYLRVTEAILRVFDAADELRQNKMMARIKVLIHRRGIDAVRQMVDDELQKPWATEESFDPTSLMADAQETPPAPLASTGEGAGDKEFLLWRATNVVAQSQEGYNAVYVKVPRGDLTADQFRALAQITRNHGSASFGLSAEQNLALRWIPDGALYAVWRELGAIDLAEAEVYTITDMTSCPGTDSCKLGITSSMGLNRAVSDAMRDWDDLLEDPAIKKLHVKASGCPNGCGRHHLANIGFQGASIKGPGGNQIPAFEVYLGGAYERGGLKYAQRVKAKVPAKHVPSAIRRLLDYYRDQRHPGEEFNDFVDRTGTDAFEALLSEFREIGPLGKDTLDYYMDWGKSILYKLERGEGECAV
jgi:sulfite reductase beta subunit-like hemoprotein